MRFPGVVVITSALHAEGLGFNPRGNLFFFFTNSCMLSIRYINILSEKSSVWFPGVVVITSASHAEGLGFDPRGNLFLHKLFFCKF